MTQHPRLMSPLSLRGQTLRNRIVFGAHTANMSDQGLPGPRFEGYILERALGGAAMIVAEPMPVHRTGVLTRGNYVHSDDAVIPGFRKITDKVKDAVITSKIKSRLGSEPSLSGLVITVETQNGRVALRGSAPDRAAADRAASIARTVDGVSSIDNQLAVVVKP
mgnify:CR=1 FL=1